MNEKKDMKTCIRPCVLMINECDKRYIIFKIFFTLIQPDNEEDADLYESNYIEKITDDILKKLTINGQIKSI